MRRVAVAMATILLAASAPAGATPPSPTLAGTHAFPVAGPAWFAKGHHDYPATDIMAACGLTVVSPVRGTIREMSRVDPWDRAVDDPATRGGRFVSILGVDGVRYYLAHFASVRTALKVGSSVVPGQPLGTVGRSGRAGACHVHVGLSVPCNRTGEWWVRRGVVSPYSYLRSWQLGRDSSPVAVVRAWLARRPNVCLTPPNS